MTDEEAVKILRFERGYFCDFKGFQEQQAFTMAIKALEQTKWIPVSERLPEEDGDYLVTTKWIGSYSGDVYIETHVAYYRKKPKEWDCVDIIVWMPLPEPYKEGEE